MKKQVLKKTRSQVSRKLEELREFSKTTQGVRSWIKYIRVALGMSTTQLADRLDLSQSNVSESERHETEGTLTINKLRRMADAMDCDLVYAFIPREKLEVIIYKQAKSKVLKSMKQAETQMALENQSVSIKASERLPDLVEEKMYSKYLWDKDNE
ncbi:MAG: mobile mystery protein A [Oligoflexia bacterium]|nr:mobile mystery protein A [Oligoflexia bacterium]MBF0364985.1 mobile mystery protein A [Oligoflexia bacterium]